MGDSRWQLWRQDDNGNVFLVRGFDTQEAAEAACAEIEARAHKQIYWVEPDPDED